MYSNEITKFEEILSNNDLKVTMARKATFKLLLSDEPQSMNQLIKKGSGTVDRVSIYRNIDLFEKLGIVKRLNIGWKYKLELTDKFLSHHHHLICMKCEKVIDIEDEQHINHFINEVSKKSSFSPLRHQFEIEGYCSSCKSDL